MSITTDPDQAISIYENYLKASDEFQKNMRPFLDQHYKKYVSTHSVERLKFFNDLGKPGGHEAFQDWISQIYDEGFLLYCKLNPRPTLPPL